MTTHEDRLTALEQSTAINIREINENLTMTLGLVQRQTFDISRITRDVKVIREKLEMHSEASNAHLEHLQSRADKAEKRQDRLETQIAEHTTRLAHIEEMLTQILARLPENP